MLVDEYIQIFIILYLFLQYLIEYTVVTRVPSLFYQVQALERKKDMYVDHIARRNEEDESSSPHQSRASSASGVESDGLKPQKLKTGLRACE